MRAFRCPTCAGLVFFENDTCLACETPLGVDLTTRELVDATDAARCIEHTTTGCNWLVPEPSQRCHSCATTRTRPADDDADGLLAWREVEQAKRRLHFELHGLGLTVDGLVFDLLSSADGPVTTGHADGVVTLDLAEADDVHRITVREDLGEPYRTVLGHLRHEVGHFYWQVLIDRAGRHDEFRARFGDERADYGAALEAHYATPRADWADAHVSAYAAAHPWEDWAETFAHVLHIRSALETAAAFGVAVAGPPGRDDADRGPWWRQPDASLPAVGDAAPSFATRIDQWLPLTYVLNELNRAMGTDPLYPFVLSPTVIDKLAFVDRLVEAAGGPSTASG